MPQAYNNKEDGKLWLAEEFICCEMTDDIDESNPRKSIASLVAAYVSKWAPYDFLTTLNVYLNKVPDLKEYILETYS